MNTNYKLESGNIYSYVIEVTISDSYEGTYTNNLVGKIICENDSIVDDNLLEKMFSYLKNGWNSFENFKIFRIINVTEDIRKCEELSKEIDNYFNEFDDIDEFDKLLDNLSELENKINPNLMGSIEVRDIKI